MSIRDYLDGRNIDGFHQNHPELIVADLSVYAPSEKVREVLKLRGVNKWLRVRRLLIALKHRWRERIVELEEQKRKLPKREQAELRGYIKALVDCRQQVRALCHSPRDVDFPPDPHDWGDSCRLPLDFPVRPDKWYFKRTDNQR